MEENRQGKEKDRRRRRPRIKSHAQAESQLVDEDLLQDIELLEQEVQSSNFYQDSSADKYESSDVLNSSIKLRIRDDGSPKTYKATTNKLKPLTKTTEKAPRE